MKPESVQKQKLPEGWKWSNLKKISINPEIGLLDGNWVLSSDMTNKKEVRLLQLADIGINKFLNISDKYVTKQKAEELHARWINAGDILIARMPDPIGRACIVPELGIPLITAVDVSILKLNPNIADSSFITYYLNSQIFMNKAVFLSSGSTRKRISRKKLELIDILLPPLSIQQKIVAKFDAQMAQIEIMKKEAKKEKETSEAYYESFINNLIVNSKNGILSKVSDVCLEDKKQISPLSEEAKKRLYVGMEDISSNTGVITINQSNQGDKILSNTFQFDNRHVLYGKLRPYLNKVAFPNFSGRCSTELIPILPKENCKREFLALLLRTEKIIHAAMKNKTGSRMPRADMSEVMKVEFNLPSLNEQEKIIQKLIQFNNNYDNLKDYENRRLGAISLLSSSILNEVFGKYEIPEEVN